MDSRRALQIVNLILALLTIGLASASFIFGASSPIYDPPIETVHPVLDSNLRFLGGIGVGLGLSLVWVTPRIEAQTAVFRVVWLCAMLGGLGRLFSMSEVGAPTLPISVFTAIEILGVPVLLYWQTQVAAGGAAKV